MTKFDTSDQKLPRGVYVLAILLFLAGGVMLVAAVFLPLQGTNIAPWYVYFLYAVYLVIIGWGLWHIKRWAYIATLLMCIILGFYQFQVALIFEQNTLFQVLGLVLIFGYLLQPKVRTRFMATATK